jgi:predicted membrane protein
MQTLANLNIWGMQGLLASWWPIIVIVTGLLLYLNDSRNYVWAFLVTGIGTVLLLKTLNIAQVDVGDLIVPGVIIAIGTSVLMRNRLRTAGVQSSNEDITAVLSGVTHRNTSDDYRGCELTAVMGGVELDLSKATVAHEAVIDVFVLMGGLELRVPENVIVKSKAVCILGGVEDKTNPADAVKAPVIYLDGTVIMGGVEIKR